MPPPTIPSSSVTLRRSIRWLPDEASEPTDTLVLTGGKTGVFVDVRFLKGTSLLDWAFAGFRRGKGISFLIISGAAVSGGEVVFEHWVDSRTLDARSVKDMGKNIVLDDGSTLEVGEMVNPDTGNVTPYEETWEEKSLGDFATIDALFIASEDEKKWYARVGGYQAAVGRGPDGPWAWQATLKDGGKWEVIYSTGGEVVLLPGSGEIFWEGAKVQWNGGTWKVLECSLFVP